MDNKDLFKLPFSETDWIGGLREGGIVVAHRILYGRRDDPVYVTECCPCDCIKTVADVCGYHINDFEFKEYAKMVEYLWEYVFAHDYQFPKCWYCYDNSKEKLYCPDEPCVTSPSLFKETMRLDEFERRYSLHPCPLPSKNLFDLLPLHSIKEFDVTTPHKRVRFECSIVKISSPKLIDGKLSQKVTIGDINTNKTISCEFGNNIADYDKWEKGQKIELYGVYESLHKIPFKVVDCRIISEHNMKLNNSQDVRKHPKYNKWRDNVKSVGECYICGRTNHLVAHHINSVAEHPELAYDESNGVCLCKSCHNVYHEDYSNTGDAKSFMDFVVRYKR